MRDGRRSLTRRIARRLRITEGRQPAPLPEVLRERIWVIVACTVLVLAAAAAYVEIASKTYKATAQLEINAASPSNDVLATLPVLHQSGDPTQDVLSGASS